MDILINRCYGGYGLSDKAVRLYLTKKNIPIVLNPQYSDSYFKYYIVEDNNQFSGYNISRNDSVIIEVVRELGKNANGSSAELKIVSIPDGCHYDIDEYDGMESIKTWFELTEEDLLKGITPEKLKTLKSVDFIKIL